MSRLPYNLRTTDARSRMIYKEPNAAYYEVPVMPEASIMLKVPAPFDKSAMPDINELAASASKVLTRITTEFVLGIDPDGNLATTAVNRPFIITGPYRQQVFDLIMDYLLTSEDRTEADIFHDPDKYADLLAAVPDLDDLLEGESAYEYACIEAAEQGKPAPNRSEHPQIRALHRAQNNAVLVGGRDLSFTPDFVTDEGKAFVSTDKLDGHKVRISTGQVQRFMEGDDRTFICVDFTGEHTELHCGHAIDPGLRTHLAHETTWELSGPSDPETGPDDAVEVRKNTIIDATYSSGFTITDRDRPEGAFIRRGMDDPASYTAKYPMPNEHGEFT